MTLCEIVLINDSVDMRNGLMCLVTLLVHCVDVLM